MQSNCPRQDDQGGKSEPVSIDFQIKPLGALSVGDVRTGTIPSLLPSQKHYLKLYIQPVFFR
ncbi:MAG: hypothetical protein V1736_06120 [Pseudomonadota bacterium]